MTSRQSNDEHEEQTSEPEKQQANTLNEQADTSDNKSDDLTSDEASEGSSLASYYNDFDSDFGYADSSSTAYPWDSADTSPRSSLLSPWTDEEEEGEEESSEDEEAEEVNNEEKKPWRCDNCR